MFTKLTIRNFKRLAEVEIELGNPVVLVGPNDSGKTSALQALTLWDLGLRRWTEKRGDQAPLHRPGVVINRRDLAGVPGLSARQMWRGLQVRKTYRDEAGQRTENIRIDVIVEGVTGHESWRCGLEFDYINEESFYCRPLRMDPDGKERMPVLPQELRPRIVLTGPVSGLAANETRIEPGAVNVRLGEGRASEVLRNLCLRAAERPDGEGRWDTLSSQLADLFGAKPDRPRRIPERGEIELTYVDREGSRLDITAAGRGMQQTLLLLAFIHLHPGGVLLLDEPEAHLEILRQRQTYDLLSRAAAADGTQVIIASHSEVILREAAGRGSVVAFVGSPHRIDRTSEVLKALRYIGFEDYYQAALTGFVLYLEGAAELALLRSFAEVLGHGAGEVLERPFVKYVGGRPGEARRHFDGLREADPGLVGYALFGRLETEPEPGGALVEHMWPRRRLENYLLPTKTLREYARQEGRKAAAGPLFEQPEADRWLAAMDKTIEDHTPRAARRDLEHPYWLDTNISDRLLRPVLGAFFDEVGLPLLMRKADYHLLVRFLEPSDVHEDVVLVLDSILAHAARARPPE